MCDPFTLAAASLAITTAGTVAGVGAQVARASAQSKAQARQVDEINSATIANYDQLQARSVQEVEAASVQAQQNQIEAAKAKATALTAAGESGVSGLSVDALLRDLYGQEARFNSGVAVNLENTAESIETSAENVRREGKSQVNSLPAIDRPNYLGAGLRIAEAGLGFSSRIS